MQYEKGEGVSFLLASTVLLIFIIIVGYLSRKVKLLYVLLVNLMTFIISVLLGIGFITPPNPSWFNPFGMEIIIVLTGIALLIGQLIVRVISRLIYRKEVIFDE